MVAPLPPSALPSTPFTDSAPSLPISLPCPTHHHTLPSSFPSFFCLPVLVPFALPCDFFTLHCLHTHLCIMLTHIACIYALVFPTTTHSYICLPSCVLACCSFWLPCLHSSHLLLPTVPPLGFGSCLPLPLPCLPPAITMPLPPYMPGGPYRSSTYPTLFFLSSCLPDFLCRLEVYLPLVPSLAGSPAPYTPHNLLYCAGMDLCSSYLSVAFVPFLPSSHQFCLLPSGFGHFLPSFSPSSCFMALYYPLFPGSALGFPPPSYASAPLLLDPFIATLCSALRTTVLLFPAYPTPPCHYLQEYHWVPRFCCLPPYPTPCLLPPPCLPTVYSLPALPTPPPSLLLWRGMVGSLPPSALLLLGRYPCCLPTADPFPTFMGPSTLLVYPACYIQPV